MAGVTNGPEARKTCAENLHWAAAHAPDQILTTEPINRCEIPGSFLNDFDFAAGMLHVAAAPNLALQFEAYHVHRITDDMMAAWSAHGHRAAQMHIGAAEDRHKPIISAIDDAAFFARLDADSYTGVVAG